MKPTDLLYVTFGTTVAALDKDSGKTEWTWTVPKGGTYNALLVEGETVFVSASGYMYALDAWSGKLRWSNELTGMGTGVPCMATTSARTTIGSHSTYEADSSSTAGGA